LTPVPSPPQSRGRGVKRDTISPTLPACHSRLAMSRRLGLVAVSLLALVAAAPAPERLNPEGIERALFFAGPDLPAADVKRFLEQAGDSVRLVVPKEESVSDQLPGVRVTLGVASEERAKALTEGGLPAIIIDQKAALLVKGRNIKVLGDG